MKLLHLVVILLTAALSNAIEQSVQSTDVAIVDITQEAALTVTVDWIFPSQDLSRQTVTPLSESVVITTICPSKCSVVTFTTSFR